MRNTRTGQGEPLALDRPVPEKVLKLLEEGLIDFVSRAAQATNMAALVAAVPFCPLEEPFNVVSLQRVMPPPRSASLRQLRHTLGGNGWSVEDLRLELLSCAIAAGVDAIFLECEEVRPNEGARYDIISLSLLGPRFTQPVGVRRAWVPTEGVPGAMEVEGFERSSAFALLAQFRKDLRQLGLRPNFAPLLSADWRYGEMDSLRSDIAALGFEYVLEVGPLYNAGSGVVDPDHPLTAGPELAERMPFGPGGEVPEPAPMAVPLPSAPDGELIVPYIGQAEPTYALARPQIEVKRNGLRGRRALDRARRLGELIGAAQPPEAARRLRLADFRIRNQAAWQAGSILFLTLYATLQGLFPKGGR